MLLLQKSITNLTSTHKRLRNAKLKNKLIKKKSLDLKVLPLVNSNSNLLVAISFTNAINASVTF